MQVAVRSEIVLGPCEEEPGCTGDDVVAGPCSFKWEVGSAF